MLISPEYLAANAEMHRNKPTYGVSGCIHTRDVAALSRHLKTEDVLDYGCGKGTLNATLDFDIREYDPCIPGKDSPPEPADIVVCTDVMEHIEPDCLGDVIEHLATLTKMMCFLNVSMCPAVKHLPDGRNAHLIIERPDWWLPKFFKHFELRGMRSQGASSNGVYPSEFLVHLESKDHADKIRKELADKIATGEWEKGGTIGI